MGGGVVGVCGGVEGEEGSGERGVVSLKERDRRMGPKLGGGGFPSFLLALHCPSGGKGSEYFQI